MWLRGEEIVLELTSYAWSLPLSFHHLASTNLDCLMVWLFGELRRHVLGARRLRLLLIFLVLHSDEESVEFFHLLDTSLVVLKSL